MKRFAIIAALALAGCHHTEPGIEVRTVYVPQPQPCLSNEALDGLPEPPAIGGMLVGDPTVDLPAVAASALRLRAWGRELMAAHRACAAGRT